MKKLLKYFFTICLFTTITAAFTANTMAGETQAVAATATVSTPAFYIYLYDNIDPELVRKIIPMLKEALFDMEFVIVPEKLEVPESAWVEVRKKYYAGDILKQLAAIKPENAIAVVGILDVDIFVGRHPYVKGLSNPAIGTSVVSVKRLREYASEYRFKLRLAKEILHELGHLLGQEHCQYPRHCVMGYSTTLAQLDAKSRFFCPYHKEQILKELKDRGLSPQKHKLPELPPVNTAEKDKVKNRDNEKAESSSRETAETTLDFIVD